MNAYFAKEALNSCKRLSTLAVKNTSSLVLFPPSVALTQRDSSANEPYGTSALLVELSSKPLVSALQENRSRMENDQLNFIHIASSMQSIPERSPIGKT